MPGSYYTGDFGVSPATAHRRFAAWTEAGVRRRLHRAVLDGARPTGRARLDLGDRGRGERARDERGPLTGPNPVDRGKKGSKLHVLSDAQGTPLTVGVSGANVHDPHTLRPLVGGVPAVRPRRGPRRRRPDKLWADKAYRSAEHLPSGGQAPVGPLQTGWSVPRPSGMLQGLFRDFLSCPREFPGTFHRASQEGPDRRERAVLARQG
ncbi:transposase [Streptomyces sp. MP131-18]|uniref:transposase n=1 Tax=Streptomyces sp. MP131-18 TaxID=1857892 RepID=UPI0009A19CC3